MARAQDLDLNSVSETVGPLHLMQLPQAEVVELPIGRVKATSLPMKNITRTTTSKHILDVITEHEGVFDFAQVRALCLEKKWQDLPPPLCFKEAPPADVILQICVVKLHETQHKYFILKHLQFKDKVKGAYVTDRLAMGNVQRISWSHPKTGMKVWQHVFENLGGWQCRAFTLAPAIAKSGQLGVSSQKDLDHQSFRTGW